MVRALSIFALMMLSGCGSRQTAPSPYLRQIVDVPQTTTTHASPPAPPSPEKPLVFLDPGHGGAAIGAQNTHRRLQEKRLNLDIAKRVEHVLVAKGYPVRLSRTKDVAISLQKRVAIAERRSAAIFVSIHINSAPNREATGTEVLYCGAKKNNSLERICASKRLGTSILNSLCQTLPTNSRGLKERGDLYVIRETTMPAVLVEVAFITNPKESLLLTSAPYKQQVALALAKGIDEFFGKQDS